jgi:ribosome-associated translation inhibitor RaiA
MIQKKIGHLILARIYGLDDHLNSLANRSRNRTIKGDSMGSSDFYIDYNIEVSDVGDEFKREIELRLRELASTHSDMIGTAVALEKVADTQTYDVHRVRIVTYKRPQDIVVTKKDPDPMLALRAALDTLEEQVRESRENFHSETLIAKSDRIRSL